MNTRHRDWVPTLLGLFIALTPLGAANGAECKIAKVASIKVDLESGKPMVRGSLNGQDIDILIDTGAALTLVTQSAAMRAGLQPTNVDGLKLIGVGGEIQVKSTTVKELTIGDFVIRDRRWYVVGDAKTDYGSLGMIVGGDLLANFDVEFDLAEDKIFWWQPKNCEKSPLAYWNQDFMLAELEHSENKIDTIVPLNGKKVRAEIDTGAATTVVDTDAASRAGFREDAPNVEQVGNTGGLGTGRSIKQHIAIFDTFDMGDLSVKNARIRVANLNYHSREAETGSKLKKEDENFPEMLIGRDFLQANRVYIANSQGYIYMTYNGGQIFQTAASPDDDTEEDTENGTETPAATNSGPEPASQP